MRTELAFSVVGSLPDVRARIRARLTQAGGYRVATGASEEDPMLATRGHRLAGLLSLQVESWPTQLFVTTRATDAGVGVHLRYQISSGWHLVGRLEMLAPEVEATLLCEYLQVGFSTTLARALAPVRRPVNVAASVNASLAIGIVVGIGLYAGFAPWTVGVVALAVGLLDQLTIAAFADLLLDGAARVPRLKDVPRAPRTAGADPMVDGQTGSS